MGVEVGVLGGGEGLEGMEVFLIFKVGCVFFFFFVYVYWVGMNDFL